MKIRAFPRSMAIALVIGFVAVFLGPDEAAEPGGKRWAVVVGIDSYIYEVTPLRCAVNDAEKFGEALIRKAGFNKDDVFVLTSRERGNRLPTKVNIVRWVSYIKAKAPGSSKAPQA